MNKDYAYYHRTSKTVATVLFAVLSAVASATAQAAIIELVENGSLTGVVGNSSASLNLPAGWTIGNTTPEVASTPDTMDQNNNAGNASTPFAAAAVASPDGGTWVGFGRSFEFANESMAQVVDGFVIGQTYTLSWYDANFGIGNSSYTSTNQFLATLRNGSVNAFSFTGSSRVLGSGWSFNTFTFTPTQTEYTLQFNLANSSQSYMSLDGVSISTQQVTSVPEPETWASLLLGMLLLASVQLTKRRKII